MSTSSPSESFIPNLSTELTSVTDSRAQELHIQKLARLKQDTEQRKDLSNRVYWLLIAQVIFLALMITFQGFGWCGFNLNDWVFGLFINGSLIHTYLLMKQIVTGVYSNEKV